MATRPKAVIESRNGEKFSPITIAKNVLTDDGQNLHDILSDRKEDMMTPTIENSSSMFKVGQGDNVDYSSNVVNGAYESMVLKGKSMVNCIQEPSSQDVVLPYEFEDGQYVTINDTKESGALGVELKGQTLVNLYELTGTPYQYRNGSAPLRIMSQNLIQGKTYMIILNFSTVNADGKGVINFFPVSVFIDGTSRQESNFNVSSTGVVKIKYTPSKTVEDYALIIGGNNFEGYNPVVIIENAMIIEYVEGMENWDIPYFEGMTSVKAPVLHSAGSLFDAQKIKPNNVFTYSHSTNIGRFEFTNRGDVIASTSIQLPAGTYDISFSIRGMCDNGRAAITFAKDGEAWYGCSRTEIYYHQFGSTTFKEVKTKHTFDAPVNVFLVGHGWAGGATGSGWCEFKDIRLTPVGKSSILSLPEEVVLRSLPNGVRDTFNTRTGVYTQRINEVVLNGSGSIALNANYSKDNVLCFDMYNHKKGRIYHQDDNNGLICDKLIPRNWSSFYREKIDEEGIVLNRDSGTTILIKIAKTKLATPDVNGVKAYLKDNPITVQYQLETPIEHKINLPSTLKSWNTTTHIYSEIPENTLYPILSHSNPTYPVILKPSTKYSIIANSYSNGHTNSAINFNLGGTTASTTVGNRVTTITTPSTLSNELLTMSGRGNKLNNVMVIEGDVTGDEPYFEGICDCKSPILSNVGKNLFDGELVQLSNKQFVRSVNYIHINSNETYAISFVSNTGVATFPTFIYYNEKKEEIGVYEGKTTKNMPQDTKFIKFQLYSNVSNFTTDLVVNVQIEQGSSTTTYEPYKSNILSCNGDKIELTEDMFEQGGVYFTKGQSFANATNNTASDRIRLKTLLNLKPNTTYRIAIDNAHKVGVQLYNNEKLAVSDTGWVSDTTFTTKGGESAVALVIRKLSSAASISMSDFKNIKLQLSEVDKAIVLRSLPNGVCDTLNVETGEYVQRIGEITLNGSETNWSVTNQAGWESTPNTIAFGQYFTPRAKAYNAGEISSVICDKFATITANETWAADKEGVSINQNSRFDIRIERTKLPDESLTGFKQWLLQNPITVQYELETPIVSTIDVQGFPFSYRNGHVQLSSGSIEQSLTPKVEYSVATNRNGQIRSNQKMVERHQKQLDRLQAMILTNLVNTQYEQTLTNLKYDLKNVREEVK